MPEPSSFAASLSDFAAGVTPLAAFNAWLTPVLMQGPTFTKDSAGQLQAHFPFEVEAAMYLDIVADPGSPSFDEREARVLAGALCAILAQVSDPDTQLALAELARSAHRTAQMIRQHLEGRLHRSAFERFLDRRHWPSPLASAVRQLDQGQLRRLAEGLEVNDYAAVAGAFDRQGESW